MIAHVILFKPRPGLSAAERGAVLEALTARLARHPGHPQLSGSASGSAMASRATSR